MEKLNRSELIELVNKIKNAEGDTEEENDTFLDHFLENVPDPSAADYIFNIKFEDLTAEEIVDRALAYKPFTM